MIQFNCPKCDHRLRAPLEAAGRSAKCRKCETRVRIPSPKPETSAAKPDSPSAGNPRSASKAKTPPKPAVSTPAATDKPDGRKKTKAKSTPHQILLEQIREQFSGQVPRNPLNFPYQFSLLAVATMMVLLPLLYVGLIIGACYSMHWYWTEILPTGMENLPRGRGAILGILLYAAPLFGGGIMILFMVKPLFFVFAGGREPRRRSLKRAGEPALFELVDRICEATRSPKPKRIDIDGEVNATASLRRGLWSLLGRDLVLTIGAPLISGMNTRQLAGVLAHEFGHFAQGGGMKTTYLIRSINFWFARVVYQRDRLDEMLDRAIAESDFRISIFLLVGKLFVVLSRMILWFFMVVAHAISCLMMRQMEYDADRYETYVAGSEQFAATSRRLTDLSVGQEQMLSVVVEGLSNHVYIDDLPGITASCADRVKSKERKLIEKRMNAETSGLFSTHPTNDRRIAAAKKRNADGLFQIERPARELFKNYDAICTGVSVDFYRNALNVMVDPNKLVKLGESKE